MLAWLVTVFFWGGGSGVRWFFSFTEKERLWASGTILTSVRGRFLFHLSIFLFLLKDIDGWIPTT